MVQAARAWWKKLICSLDLIGLKKGLADNCLMKRSNKNGTVILCIYVNDICCIGEEKAITKAIKEIEKIYNIKQVGELNEFVGIRILTDNNEIYLTQPESIKRLENIFGEEMTKMRRYDIPAGPNDVIIQPGKNDNLLADKQQSIYRSGVGILLWLMKHS